MTPPPFTTRRLALAPATIEDVDALWVIWRDADGECAGPRHRATGT